MSYILIETSMKKLFTFLIIYIMFHSVNAQELVSLTYQDGDQELAAWVTPNTGENLPGVLILPAWKGVDHEAIEAAHNLQQEGFIALIADIYGVGQTPTDNAAAAKVASRYISDYKAYQHRISLALKELRKLVKNDKKVAVIGYCFGGTGTLEVVRAGMDVEGVVCIHGGLKKSANRPNEAIGTKILVLHPAEDTSVSEEDYKNLINEFREGGAEDWQIITYANSKHTFTNSESSDYNALMAVRAWKHTIMFLSEILK